MGKTLLVWGTKPTPISTSLLAWRLVISSPCSVTLPEWTFTRPNMALSRVDLPAPLGPMMPIISPGWPTRLQPLRMFTPGR